MIASRKPLSHEARLLPRGRAFLSSRNPRPSTFKVAEWHNVVSGTQLDDNERYAQLAMAKCPRHIRFRRSCCSLLWKTGSYHPTFLKTTRPMLPLSNESTIERCLGFPPVCRLLAALLICVLFCAVPRLASAQQAAGQRWAVLIAVDDYAYANDLKFCGADQRALAERLTAAGFREDHVFLLHNEAKQTQYLPLKRNIEKQLSLVLGLVQEDDLLLLAFSGHGVHFGGTSYLCPADAMRNWKTRTR